MFYNKHNTQEKGNEMSTLKESNPDLRDWVLKLQEIIRQLETIKSHKGVLSPRTKKLIREVSASLDDADSLHIG
jgi:hypothetical protein